MSAPLFAASRVAQAETGLVSAEGLYTTGSRLGTKPTVASNLGLATLAHLFATQGLVGLWRGSEVLVARGALMSATQLTTYDWTKRQLKQELGVADGPALHIGSSFVASLTLTTAICPLDVIYTKFLHAGPPATPLSSARQLLHEGGAAALFRGWTPLWARFLPSSVLTFVIYERVGDFFSAVSRVTLPVRHRDGPLTGAAGASTCHVSVYRSSVYQSLCDAALAVGTQSGYAWGLRSYTRRMEVDKA